MKQHRGLVRPKPAYQAPRLQVKGVTGMNEMERPQGQCTRCHRRLMDPVSIYRGMGPVCWAASNGDAFAADMEASDEEWARREKLLKAGGEIDLGCHREFDLEFDQGEDYMPCRLRVSIRYLSETDEFEAYGRLVSPSASVYMDNQEVSFLNDRDLRAVYAAAVMAGLAPCPLECGEDPDPELERCWHCDEPCGPVRTARRGEGS